MRHLMMNNLIRNCFTVLFLMHFVSSVKAQNGKKVFVDFHGTRTTREMDGTFGLWKYSSRTTGSQNGPKSLVYNPDVILENGKHDIASANYPLVDVQSQLDPTYLEYAILSAKVSKIDGFFVDLSYRDHSSNSLLTRIRQIAQKIGFGISVTII